MYVRADFRRVSCACYIRFEYKSHDPPRFHHVTLTCFKIHEIGSPIKFVGKFVAFGPDPRTFFLRGFPPSSHPAAERNSSVREEVDTSEQFPYTVSPSTVLVQPDTTPSGQQPRFYPVIAAATEILTPQRLTNLPNRFTSK